MRHIITRPILALMNRFGYEVVPYGTMRRLQEFPFDFSADDIETCRLVEPYTMVPRERIYTLVRAVEHVVKHGISGTLVECGVWKGGCAMAMARTLVRLGVTDRDLYFYDLFGEPWPPSTEFDVHLGVPAPELDPSITGGPDVMRYTLEEVRERLLATGYPAERMHFVKGAVDKTLPADAPARIAVLRLDTDLYESTLHEFEHLYPRLEPGGILIIDDYGDWSGSHKATDEYIERRQLKLHLIRVDVGARMAVKP
jgi:hypothetical protein